MSDLMKKYADIFKKSEAEKKAEQRVMYIGIAMGVTYILFLLGLIGFIIWVIIKIMAHFGVL